MGTTCVAYRVWSSNRFKLLLTQRGEAEADGKETFQTIDLIEILVRWFAGRSQVQIADSLGLDLKTVRKYLAPITAAGLVSGGPPVMTEAEWRTRAASWFPAVVDRGLRQVTWHAIAAHRHYIRAQLEAGHRVHDSSVSGRRVVCATNSR